MSWPSAAEVASIRARLQVTDNTSRATWLNAGSGLDWFWEEYAQTNHKAGDRLNWVPPTRLRVSNEELAWAGCSTR